MKIGEVATAAAVNIETLRYYERRGLLKEPARTSSGYRAYSEESVRLVRFIKLAQRLGFSLSEIEELLRLQDKEAARSMQGRAIVERKLHQIEIKLASLLAMKEALSVFLRPCANPASFSYCPIVEALIEREPLP